jgi:hypothetical protein
MTSFEDPRLNQSYWALRVTYILVPVLAGLDKFTNLLTYWPRYLSPAVTHTLPLSAGGFMRIVGVVEIIVGLLVASRLTRVGAYIVTAWLVLIAINLVSMHMLDIAVRDLAMAVGSFALARLEEVRVGETGRVSAHRRTEVPA